MQGEVMDRRRKYHACKANGEWSLCCACLGRIHQADCTARKNPDVDCCAARHRSLHDSGHVYGLDDSGIIMWTPKYEMGISRNAYLQELIKQPCGCSRGIVCARCTALTGR